MENGVKNALKQADLTDVSVSEDAQKNTITLSGKVHSEDAKLDAARVAQAAAGDRLIVNEISVQPVGTESRRRMWPRMAMMQLKRTTKQH